MRPPRRPGSLPATLGSAATPPASPAATRRPQKASQVAFLERTGQATQTANIAAGTYTLSIRAAQRGNYQLGIQSCACRWMGSPSASTNRRTRLHQLHDRGIYHRQQRQPYTDPGRRRRGRRRHRLRRRCASPPPWSRRRPNDQLRCARRPDAGRIAVHSQCDGIVGVAGELLVADHAGVHGFRNHRHLGRDRYLHDPRGTGRQCQLQPGAERGPQL